ncbi:hypothetical protein M9H77_10103 [Catharanthus roseus]|uniref:Uncharacterized protein n=1 Tax=Catharanthus roseus TaxID=4058 RepID=A0ACC0C330_CATRO|nr:hypothetical protein M9H77_10103 [Catharanthus roseus]
MVRKGFFGLFILIVLMAFISQGTLPMAEARMCESQSHGYKGPCLRDHNCALVCRTEGFSGGICQGFRRRCFCTRRC